MRPAMPPQPNYQELSEELATQLHTLKLKYEHLLQVNQKMREDKTTNLFERLWAGYQKNCHKVCHK